MTEGQGEEEAKKKVNIWQWATRSREIVECAVCFTTGQQRFMHSIITDGPYPRTYQKMILCNRCWENYSGR